MKEYSFEKLVVWKDARELVKIVYKITKKYPAEEKYGLNSQSQRAAVSVMSNIAEGSTRFGNKSQANFYQIAYSSLMELLSELIVANDLEYIERKMFLDIRQHIDKISNKLNSLYKSTKDAK